MEEFTGLDVRKNNIMNTRFQIHPQRNNTNSQTTETASATQRVISLTARKVRCIYAADSNPINNRSPRVVAIGRNPFLSVHGETIS